MITLDSNIRQRVDSVVHDNVEFISQSGGNVAEWLLASTEDFDDYEWFLSIEDRESDFDRAELIEEVESFILSNYDYNLNILDEEEVRDAIETLISDGTPPKTDTSLDGWNEFIETNFGEQFCTTENQKICETQLYRFLREDYSDENFDEII